MKKLKIRDKELKDEVDELRLRNPSCYKKLVKEYSEWENNVVNKYNNSTDKNSVIIQEISNSVNNPEVIEICKKYM